MEKSFNDFIKKEGLLQGGGTALLGISGGVDSIVLFHLLLQNNISFACAHVNYQLRDDDSNHDEILVRELCEQHHINFHSTAFDTKQYCAENKLSIQEGARQIRYDFFKELKHKHSYTSILTAHHRDDAIETFFINLTRGTGTHGLTGIQVKNKDIERPLLFASKQEIYQFAKNRELNFREDKSNEDNKYLRNKIRNEIIPIFEKANPSFSQTMYENLLRIKEASDYIKAHETLLRQKYFVWKNEKCYISKDVLLEEHAFICKSILLNYGFSPSQIENLLTNPTQGSVFQTDQYTIHIERDTLILCAESTIEEHVECYEINEVSDFAQLPIPIQVAIEKPEKIDFKSDTKAEYVDYDKSFRKMTARKWQEGDKFRPLGMRGKKLVSDFLQQKKVPTISKRNHWILLADTQIICILGQGISDDFKVTENTKRVLKLRI